MIIILFYFLFILNNQGIITSNSIDDIKLGMSINDFYLWYLIILVSYFIFLFGYMNFSHKPDTLNNFFGFISLFFVLIHILVFLLLMFQEKYFYKSVLPLWLLVLGLPLLLIWITVVISTVVFHLYKLVFKTRDFSKFAEKSAKKMQTMKKTKRDTLRKISHVLMFIGIFVIWYIGYDIVKHSGKRWAGMVPEEDNMLFLYLTLLKKPESIREVLFALGWFYYLLFFFFYVLSLVLLANELTRKSKYLAFPFNLSASIFLCEEEKEGYGTYLYFAIGQMFAAFLCPPMVFFAILGISSISDLCASQIGIRFGKHHILWNKDKTWEGTMAATLSSIVICYFFVGIAWALVFTGFVVIFDIFTDKPFNLSDNLLNPIGLSLLYILLRYFLEFGHYTIILEWI